MRVGITAKLMLIPAGLVCLALLAVGTILERRERDTYIDGVADRLEAQARLLVPELRDLPAPAVAAWARAAGRRAAARVTVVAADGRVLGDSHEDSGVMENHAGRTEVREALAGRTGRSLQESPTLRREELRLAVPAPGPTALRLALPLEALAATLARIRSYILAVSALVLAGTLGLGFLLARQLTRPVHQMVRQSQALAGGDLSQRTSIATNDEMAELGRSLNRMADALQDSLRRLEDERDRVRTILENMAEGVVLIGPDGRIREINAAGAGMLGLGQHQAAGQRPLEAVRSYELADLLDRARRDGRAAGELALTFPTYRVLEASVVALKEGAGAEGILLVLRDVTELRRLEAIRMEFVANVSHELRTPLTAIRGFVETLLEGALDSPAEARRFLETAARHAERLSRLLDDLLDLSNIELGRTPLHTELVVAREVIEHVAAGLEPVASKKHLRLSVEAPGDLPPVLADRDRLAQVLINLVDNAIKFTPEGGTVSVAARRAAPGAAGLSDRTDAVEIAVTDTGIGIPPKDLPRITERFYRVDKGRSRELGGTGLGLAIVKHLVHAHGGTLSVNSEPGKGTQVRFTLPAGRRLGGSPEGDAMRPLRVMFVCTGNSARSQMAGAFARHFGGWRVVATSAGVDPKGLNPLAAEVMQERGIDISGQTSMLFSTEEAARMDYVITVCHNAEERCPVLPSVVKRLHWPIKDPAATQGTREELVEVFRNSRDEIEARVRDLLRQLLPPAD